MTKEIGVWVDHREAVIVTLMDRGEEIKRIKSKLEKHVRFSGEEGMGEDVRDRRFENHLNNYYAEVIAYVRDADSILIFGPGEAKSELEKRIRQEGVRAQILPVETVDKLTDRQIRAKVRRHFPVRDLS